MSGPFARNLRGHSRPMRALLIGATGFLGMRLGRELRDRGHAVAAMTRDSQTPQAGELQAIGAELRRADLTDPASLGPALEDVEVVYYLAHLMSAGGDDLVAAEIDVARALGEAASAGDATQVVYLGGLGDPDASEHLRARHATAVALRDAGPPLTYFRAAMVVGHRSASYELLRSLVDRLPAMISPEWLENRTQPIGAGDVVRYLADAPGVEAARGREIQIGGPEVMTYTEMLEGMSRALGKNVPWRLPTPIGISAEAVGNVAGAVTRGDPRIAEHLTAGLATDTVVEDPSGMELFEIEPKPYELSLARAIEDEARAADRPSPVPDGG
jgi:uncharacterized protein YbjT (DUF2867 family)